MKYPLSLMVLCILMMSGCASSHVFVNAELQKGQDISIRIETTTAQE